MSTLAEMQEVVRFSNRMLPLLDNDIDRVENVLTDMCDELNMAVELTRTQATVYEIISDHSFLDTLEVPYTSVFLCKYQSEGGGTIALFDDNSPPSMTGGTYIPTFYHKGIAYNGFLYDTTNY